MRKKLIAFSLLLIYGVSVFYPGTAYALTSGPSQPEASKFQAVSITNLVDPFTGDFSYNIPLLDIDGYPLNIAYSSGGSMDDESSWVGYGWNINPGSMTRVMKGIPDDFDGTDQIRKESSLRPDVTGGVAFNVSSENFGFNLLGANGSVDVFYNNQRGLGVEIGAGLSASLSTAKHVAGKNTAGLAAGGNLGITSNSQTGADFNFGMNMGMVIENKDYQSADMGFRFGGSLNSRQGLKSTTLGASFNTSKREGDVHELVRKLVCAILGKKFVKSGSSSSSMTLGSSTTYYGQAFTPSITMPMKNEAYSLSPQAGPEFWGFHVPAIQLTGHYSRQALAVSDKYFPAYGFLHSAKGRIDPDALLDFNRERDVPYTDQTPTLAVPYVTQDLFTATSHLGSSQFKAFSNGSGIFFDAYASNNSSAFSLGLEFGLGGGIKGGGDFSASGTSTVSRKWVYNNDFLTKGDFSTPAAADGEESFFKLVGEKSSVNKDFLKKIIDREPVRVQTNEVNDQGKAFATLQSKNKDYPVSSPIARDRREPRGEVLSTLTASQAQNFGLDKYIKNYTVLGPSDAVICNSNGFGSFSQVNRVSGSRKGHHLSQMTVTKNNGVRLVYGHPVYNNLQVDVTFSVDGQPDANNLVNYSPEENSTNNKSGIDHFFSRETVPAYASSFLLSGVCSPDYVDVTGNGITDDDLGTAVGFNYSRVNEAYKWRTPNDASNANYANFNAGNKSDDEDNKASYSYGTKELWYTHSIESKNMVAVFRLGDREDGLGFNPDGSIDNGSRQKKLERIDLYTKAELLKPNPVPIKSIHFEYDYSLFGNVPNNSGAAVMAGGVNLNAAKGKLTLKSIYFTYGSNMSGEENRYYFGYSDIMDFKLQQYDRWGNYKDKAQNISIAGIDLDNNDFPYTVQDKATADASAKKWQLTEIELPSGGRIKINYESDDYAFVQDRRAMQMAEIVGYGKYNPNGPMTDGSGHLIDASANPFDYRKMDKIYVRLPGTSTAGKVRWEYFDGVDQLFFKTMVDVDNNGNHELVSGWAKVLNVTLVPGTDNIAEVQVDTRGGFHPVAAAAWQHLRMQLPKLAYPYEVDETLGPLAFVMALIQAIGNVAELLQPFEDKAMSPGHRYALRIVPDKGFARIGTKLIKYGGGSRVKRVVLEDIWEDMAGTGNGLTTSTGMEFDYSMDYTAPDGEVLQGVSSGVASYEPMPGNEENPFRQPITYQQKQHLTSNMLTVEEPLGESYFPAPSVGYSQVRVKNLDAESNPTDNGYTVHKFYTARDFPTIAKRTDLSKNRYNQKSIFGLFEIDQGNSVVLSQGFYVENNDMHGKPKSEETFDPDDKLIAGTYYSYKSSGTEHLTLDNNALTLQPDGTVKNEIIAQESEIFHDMREQVTDNLGVNLNVNLDVLYFVLFVLPIPTAIPIVQSSYCGYQSASTIKVVNRYGIPDKITTIENGSTVVAENMLWDALTGEVLLTRTQNGYDDPIYNFTLPAYMVQEYEQQLDNTWRTVDYEKGMGAAYKNTGIIFHAQSISSGVLPSAMGAYIVGGDEVGIAGTNTIIWAIEVPGVGIRMIDKDGDLYTGSGDMIVLRSGRRNILGASSYSVVSLKNPIRNGKIEIDANTEVLNTAGGTFSDEWAADVAPLLWCREGEKEGGTDCCPVPFNDPINPYVTGLKGNWRANKSFVYSTGRDPRIDPNNPADQPTDIRKGGIFTQFTSFYQLQSGRFLSQYHNDDNWIASSYVTRVNGKGLEVENKDALGRYSSAQFGFNDLLATAVASNARSNEIGYDGFEDYNFGTSCFTWEGAVCSEDAHFNFRKAWRTSQTGEVTLDITGPHTGRYCLKVSANSSEALSFRKVVQSLADDEKYDFNGSGQMVLKPGGVVTDFQPMIGKKYLISGWIKGDVASLESLNDPSKASITLRAYDGSTPLSYTATAVRSGPKVEGWIRVMGEFEVPTSLSTATDLKLAIMLLPGASDAFFDDVRIHPYDGNMKSFAYDEWSSRLMAELDENNYATFFEYNDEGQLTRTKKETEKGIITLNEARSRLRNNSQN